MHYTRGSLHVQLEGVLPVAGSQSAQVDRGSQSAQVDGQARGSGGISDETRLSKSSYYVAIHR